MSQNTPEPTSMTFYAKLARAWSKSDSMLCIGLDPEPARFPDHLKGSIQGLYEFNRSIIDATKDLVCAYKPQIAFYSAFGQEEALRKTIQYIRQVAPEVLVILDSKRGDIGNTAVQYAKEAFERYGADSVTVNPYLGSDSVEPFLADPNRGAFILCRTSNPGSRDLQDLICCEPSVQGESTPVNRSSANGGCSVAMTGRPLYQLVAEKATTVWNRNGNVGLVVGATFPRDLELIRKQIRDIPLLVPGIGAQGGSLAEVLAVGRATDGYGLLINVSRAVLYASSGSDFSEKAREIAEGYVREMRST